MKTLPKVLPREVLATTLQAEREAGRRIVCTNGVFDLLHIGHIRLLQAARGAGDVLVVAINEDTSVTHLKGPGRPFQPAAERAEILAALACVDWVTFFPEETASETLRLLQPQVHAKGEDRSPDDLPLDERTLAEELGMDTLFLGGPKVRSSSDLGSRSAPTLHRR